MGGGPAATTLEVAIYQALRFDFDPARAVTLTLAADRADLRRGAGLDAARRQYGGDANLPVAPRRYLSAGRSETALNAALIGLALLFVAGPMAATVVAGLGADLGRLAGEAAVRQATLTSVVLAFLSALLAVALSLSLIMARRALALMRGAGPRTLLEHATDTGAGFVLVVPPIVIGAGWFLLLAHDQRRLCRRAGHGRRRQRGHGDALCHPRRAPRL